MEPNRNRIQYCLYLCNNQHQVQPAKLQYGQYKNAQAAPAVADKSSLLLAILISMCVP